MNDMTLQLPQSRFGYPSCKIKCETTATVWIENLGNGHFKMHQLPLEAQFAPVNAIVADDLDHDGNIDHSIIFIQKIFLFYVRYFFSKLRSVNRWEKLVYSFIIFYIVSRNYIY